MSEIIDRLRALSTTSLIDAAPTLRVLPLAIRPVVPGVVLAGRVRTAKANRDLMSLIEGLHLAEPGDVLVVDAGGMDRAVSGELFATEARRRGLAALVLFGLCRDRATLSRLGFPVFACGSAPNAYAAQAIPEVDVELSLDGVVVRPGEILVADDDGLLVGSEEEMLTALPGGEEIQAREVRLQGEIADGRSLIEAAGYEAHVAARRAGEASSLRFS